MPKRSMASPTSVVAPQVHLPVEGKRGRGRIMELGGECADVRQLPESPDRSTIFSFDSLDYYGNLSDSWVFLKYYYPDPASTVAVYN